jgi:hypothetical protein
MLVLGKPRAKWEANVETDVLEMDREDISWVE